MSISRMEIEKEDGEVVQVFFECERRELREVVGEINDDIMDLDVIDQSKAIRQKKSNPVIKTDHNDRIYFHWDEGRVRMNVKLSQDDVLDTAVEYIQTQAESGQEDDAPWDQESAAERAREEVRDRQERQDRRKEDEEGGREERESRRTARGEKNRRDRTQREPRGGSEHRGRGNASIEGDHTKFIPPYDKMEVDYHGPAGGEKAHLDCKDCVHFIEGGGCHMVQGEIDRDGYCEDLYADVGIFARMYDREFEINLASWGEMFEDRFQNVSFEIVSRRVKEAIRKKL